MERAQPERYLLRLYIAGRSRLSQRAVVNVKAICREHLPERHILEVIDIEEQPELAGSHQIVAAPTLVKESPLPHRRFIGDMPKTSTILQGLGLDPES
ncbi:circadian clock KaiB family protein [Geomesophilobacter sediminis]|uniref:circadian clock KaiB family protein n=1 Tax=Geomesophilobacter sediminis TaxID=2798584 RepID=UPI001F2BF44F|nr:circadian clock KaiB family protein [Geomesophilobacter sediminis]